MKTALKYVTAWGIVAAFLALLTIIFSFLGALFCAALGGMMMGATGASRRLSVFYSVLCPGVLFAVMRSQRTELAPRKIVILVAICLAAFWVIYCVAAALMAQEQKTAASNAKLTPGDRVGILPLNGRENGPAAAVKEPSLEALEGYWCCDTCDQDGRAHRRVLEIKNGAAVVGTLDAEGHLCTCARGRLQWLDSSRSQALPGAAEADEAFPSPAI